MDVSRITRGKLELRRTPVELASAIDHAIESCRPALGERSLEIVLPDQSLYINGDRARLGQVFSNLLNNACKLTAARGCISIRSERRGDDVLVSVKDDGVGIPPEKLNMVFEMLTSMQILRPAATRRVLVVDDNHDAAQSLAQLLTFDGHQTKVAYDGTEALEKTRAFEPEVIFLDIGMPGMNGYDTCRALRDKWGNAVSIVALTGWGQEADRRKSEEAGFDAHLVKPVTHEALTALLSANGKTGSELH